MHPDPVGREQRLVVAHRHDERVGAVLGLRGEVGGGPVRALGEDHAQVARPGEAVDPDEPAQLALGLLHVEVAGPDDDVDPPDRLRPVRERGDRLRAAHRVDLVRPAQRRRGEDHRVVRRSDDDLVDPGRARRHRAHQHRGRVRRPPPGRVDRGAPDRDVPEPHRLALVERDLRLRVEPGRGHRGDVGRRQLQRLPDVGVERLERRRELGRRDAKRPTGGPAERSAVGRATAACPGAEPPLVLRQRGVAAQPHVLDDRGHVVGDRSGGGDGRAHLRRHRGGALDGAATPHRGSARAARRSRPPSACARPGSRSGGRSRPTAPRARPARSRAGSCPWR